jgi:hypothetical protein
VGQRHVDDAAPGQVGDVGVDLGRRGAEREASLDRVDDRGSPRGQGGVEGRPRRGPPSRPAARRDVILDELDLVQDGRDVAGFGGEP